MELLFSFFMILVGFGSLIFSADHLVEGPSSLTRRFSVWEIAIGLTPIAGGTSLPGLETSIGALKKVDMAVDNFIGSNIFNIFLFCRFRQASLICPIMQYWIERPDYSLSVRDCYWPFSGFEKKWLSNAGWLRYY